MTQLELNAENIDRLVESFAKLAGELANKQIVPVGLESATVDKVIDLSISAMKEVLRCEAFAPRVFSIVIQSSDTFDAERLDVLMRDCLPWDNLEDIHVQEITPRPT